MARDEVLALEIGARIKELRESNGLKQQPIADAVGVQLRTYQMWQSGEITPQGENLERLAKALKTTPQFILRGNTTPPVDPEALEERLDRRLRLIEESNDRRLAAIEEALAKQGEALTELLARRPVITEPVGDEPLEETLAYLNAIVRASQEVLSRSGRDVGRRDLDRRAAQPQPSPDPPAESPPAAA